MIDPRHRDGSRCLARLLGARCWETGTYLYEDEPSSDRLEHYRAAGTDQGRGEA